MKKLLLATAVAALSVSAAHAAPTVYGKAFVTADYYDKDKGFDSDSEKKDYKATKLNSDSSRIGLKGAESLTANTDLVYQLEYGIEIDDSNGGKNKGKNQNQFYSRDTYLGLANKQYGTFLAGRLTTIDDMINYANLASGGVIGGDNDLASIDGPRANNAFAYVSPSYSGLNFLGMYALNGNSKNDYTRDDLDLTLPNGKSADDYDKWGVGVKYEPEGQPYRLGTTYMSVGSDKVKDIRVSGAYDLTPAFTLGGLYQNTDIDGADKKENAYTLSGSYKTVTPLTVYGQADYVKNVLGTDGDDTQRYLIGSKYAFNKATTGHIYGAYMNKDFKDADSAKGYSIGTGIEYLF